MTLKIKSKRTRTERQKGNRVTLWADPDAYEGIVDICDETGLTMREVTRMLLQYALERVEIEYGK